MDSRPDPQRRPSSHARPGLLTLLLAPSLLLATVAWAASPPATRGEEAMVVSPDRHATAIGLATLRAGGNAVDAAVAVTFALGVTYPLAGPIGGGGFALYRTPDGEAHALDFREVAPARLRAELFLDEEGRPIPGLSVDGGLAVGVPGTVAGLAEAHRRWGALPWEDLVRPAVELAAGGFEVSPFLALTLERQHQRLAADAEAREIFLRQGRPLAAGARLVQTDLAATLDTVARQGAAGFYGGPVASALVAALERAGGVMEASDLERYRPVLRAPLYGSYRGRRVICFPPPSSGGVALLQILGMLERHDLRAAGFGSSLAIHLIAEAERRAFADRSRWLGDPDFAQVPVEALLDPDYLAERAAGIRPRRATPSRKIAPGEMPVTIEAGETLHLVTADAAGGAVSLTATLNGWFGSAMVAAGTGVLLNNEMDDFALAPGVPNLYGLLGGKANAVEPRKRPLSSMSPTIIERAEAGGRPLLVLGSPGGSTIISTVAQVLINVVDHELPLQAAVDAPRFHHQWQPDRIFHEPRAFSDDVVRALRERGHDLRELTRFQGNANAIGLAPDGAWLGAADPRRQGAAAGY